jgi:hypothetical protein
MKSMEGRVTSEAKGDILLRIVVQRHGPKLSAAGEKNQLAAYFAESVKSGLQDAEIGEGEGLIHINSSPVTRAMDTARIDREELSHTDHRLNKEALKKEALAVPFQPLADASDPKFARDLDRIVAMQKSIEPRVRAEIDEKNPNLPPEEREAMVRNVIDMQVLSALFNDEHVEGKTFETSYIELADKFATRYKGFLRHVGLLEKQKEAGKQPIEEPYVQIDISHSFPVTCFLKRYLVFTDGTRAQDLSPEEFFERTGGIIRESGSLEMQYRLQKDTSSQDRDAHIALVGSFSEGKEFSGEIVFHE